MKHLKKQSIVGIIFICLQIFAISASVNVLNINEEILTGNDINPYSSAVEDYLIKWPSLDYSSFSPQSSPGSLDEISLSFLASVDIEYDINITALPRQFLKPDYTDISLLRLEDTGKLLIFACRLVRSGNLFIFSIEMTSSNDDGKTWSEFTKLTNDYISNTWDDMDSPSATYKDGQIHLLFTKGNEFGNQSQILYMNSSDQGVSWDGPTMICDSIDFMNSFPEYIALDYNPVDGVIHAILDTAEFNGMMWDFNMYTFNSTDDGDTWSVPERFPGTTTRSSNFAPDLDFNSTGAAFLCYSSGNRLLYEFPNGFWGSYEVCSPPLEVLGDKYRISVDDVTDEVYILGLNDSTIFINDANLIYRVDSVAASAFTLYAEFINGYYTYGYTSISFNNGEMYYAANTEFFSITDLYFEKFNEEIHCYSSSGFVPQYIDGKVIWDGKKNSQIFTNYTNFIVNLTLANTTEKSFIYPISRDDLAPDIRNFNHNFDYISPMIRDGNQDSLITNFTSIEEIEYSYSILSENISSLPHTLITSAAHEKFYPKIIQDSRGNYFVFYLKRVNELNQLVYHKSVDGGKNWESAKELTPVGAESVNYYTVCTDISGIYVLTEDGGVGGNGSLIKSFDSGVTWEYLEISSDFLNYRAILAVSTTGTLYACNSTFLGGGEYQFYLFNSTDGGKNWNMMYDFGSSFKFRPLEIDYDSNNDNLYILYTNSSHSGDTYTTYIHIPTDSMAESTYVHNLWSGHDSLPAAMTLIPSEQDGGNTTVNVFRLTDDDAPDDYNYIEKFTSYDNNGTGTYSNIKIALTSADSEYYLDMFYESKKKSDLRVSVEDDTGLDIIYLDGNSTIVDFGVGRVSVDQDVEIEFDGKDMNNEYISNGNYIFDLSYWDNAKNQNSSSYSFIVDNLLPNVTVDPINWPEKPIPEDDVEISFDVFDEYIANVTVKYRHSNDGDWKTASVIALDGDNGTYNSTIPGDPSSSSLLYYIELTDLAGNILTYDNDGVYYSWSDPEFEYIVEIGLEGPNVYDNIPFTVYFLKGAQFVDLVKIETDANLNISLQLDSAGIYKGTLPSINSLEVNYNLSYIDSFGRKTVIMQGTLIRPSVIPEESPEVVIGGKDEELTTRNELIISGVLPLEYLDYISEVVVSFRIDQGDWMNFTCNITSGIYNGTIGPFINGTTLEFKIYLLDTLGNSFLIDDVQSMKIIPAMPELSLSADNYVLIGIISAVIGLVIGMGYIFTVQRQTRDPRDIFIEAYKHTRKVGKRKNYSVLEDPVLTYMPKEKNLQFNIVLTVSFIGSLGGLIYFMLISNFEYATLFATAIAFLSVILFQHNMNSSIEVAVRNPKKLKNAYFMAILFIFILTASIGLIFYIGSFIQWFNYYVYEVSYTIGSFVIPAIWVNIGTTIVSTLGIVVISTTNSVKRLNKSLADYARNGISARNLYTVREESLKSILRRFMIKVMVFVVTVAVSVITTTNLGTYSNVGLILLVPFVATLFLIIMMFGYRHKSVKASETLVVDALKCTLCGEIVPDGQYCQSCGKPIVEEQIIFEQTKTCEKCETKNPINSQYCRSCGFEVKTGVKENKE